jgi:hypothetical protein
VAHEGQIGRKRQIPRSVPRDGARARPCQVSCARQDQTPWVLRETWHVRGPQASTAIGPRWLLLSEGQSAKTPPDIMAPPGRRLSGLWRPWPRLITPCPSRCTAMGKLMCVCVMAHRVLVVVVSRLMRSPVLPTDSAIANARFEGYFCSQIVQCPLLRTPDEVGAPWRRMTTASAALLPSPHRCAPWSTASNGSARSGVEMHCKMPVAAREGCPSSPEIICTALFTSALGRLSLHEPGRRHGAKLWLGPIIRARGIEYVARLAALVAPQQWVN